MPEIFGAALMGGGSGRAYAAIGAIYPAGATCTCSYGGKTIAAKDTSGRALFLVPSAGQWLVKATNGGREVEDTVSITTQGQVETVTLTYELVLIDNGTVDTALTGDWQATRYDAWDTGNTAPRVSIDSSGVNAYSGVGTYAAISHAKAFDVTSYSTLTIRMYAYQSRGTSIKVGLSTSNTGGDLAVALGQWGGSSKPTTGILDVSSLTGNYYFKAASGEQMTIGIQDIRLT